LNDKITFYEKFCNLKFMGVFFLFIKIDPNAVRYVVFNHVNMIGSYFNSLSRGINVCLMQHIFAPVSINTGNVMLFNVALVYSGSVIMFIL